MQGAADGAVRGTGLNDNWDDAEGYYSKYLRARAALPMLLSWF